MLKIGKSCQKLVSDGETWHNMFEMKCQKLASLLVVSPSEILRSFFKPVKTFQGGRNMKKSVFSGIYYVNMFHIKTFFVIFER